MNYHNTTVLDTVLYWAKNTSIDQLSRKESLEIDLYMYDKLTSQGCENNSVEESQSSTNVAGEREDSQVKRSLISKPYIIYKIDPKLIIYLNINYNIIKIRNRRKFP